MSETTIDSDLYDKVYNYLQEIQGIADLLMGASGSEGYEISNDTLTGIASSIYFRTSALREAWYASEFPPEGKSP